MTRPKIQKLFARISVSATSNADVTPISNAKAVEEKAIISVLMIASKTLLPMIKLYIRCRSNSPPGKSAAQVNRKRGISATKDIKAMSKKSTKCSDFILFIQFREGAFNRRP